MGIGAMILNGDGAGRGKTVYGEGRSEVSYLDLVRGQDLQMQLQLVMKSTDVPKREQR